MVIGSIVGWSWNLLMIHFDPNFEAWSYFPWNDIGPRILGMAFADWLFYPVCGMFFLIIISSIDYRGREKQGYVFWVVSALLVSAGLGIGSVTVSSCLMSITCMLTIPGVVMCCFGFWWDRKHYLYAMTFVVVFASVWDVLAVTTLPYLFGFNVSNWYYLNELGQHSTVFADKSKYPLMWLWNSPIEITPLFSIGGFHFIYGLWCVFRKK